MDFLSQALKFLEIKSVSEEGNEEAINFLIPLFEQAGAKLMLQQVPHSLRDHSKRQYNLLAIFGDDLVDSRTKKGLLFTAPVDTCNPGNHADWTELKGDPFKPRADKDHVYGAGAANSKLNFMAMLASADTFSRSKFLQPLYVAATCGGESVLAGSRYLIQSGAVNPKHVIVGRPTNLTLQHTEKALLVFHLRISFVAVERDAQEFNAKVFISSKSRAVHSGHAQAEKNALENVLFFLESLKSSQVENKLISLQGVASLNRMPDMASAGVVIRSKDLDTIRDRFRSISANNRDCQFEMRLGGTGDRGVKLLPEEVYSSLQKIREEIRAINEVMAPATDEAFLPDHSVAVLSSVAQGRDALDLTVQISLIPGFASPEARKEIEKDFKDRISAVARNFRAVSIECRKVFATQRFFTDPSSTFVTTLKADMTRAGLPSHHQPGNFGSEAAHFCEKGYEAIAFGAGNGPTDVNCPNERARQDDLQSAIRFYSRAIEAFCLRGI
jgi:acetylornithine deacetylase/succinyl-diaminopimelate desuccinylase-like protein